MSHTVFSLSSRTTVRSSASFQQSTKDSPTGWFGEASSLVWRSSSVVHTFVSGAGRGEGLLAGGHVFFRGGVVFTRGRNLRMWQRLTRDGQ